METTPQGRQYPSKGERTPNKRQQAKLDRRIRNFEKLTDVVDAKTREGYNGFYYYKPGSNKK